MIRIVALALSFSALVASAEPLRLEESENSMRVLDGESLLTEFRTDWKVPYLYPLLSPSGANVTRHWPIRDNVADEARDHPHHRSLWLAHGAVNGFDFWAFHDGKDAAISHRGFSHSGVAADGSAKFSCDLAWTGGGKTHLTEKRTHTFRKDGDRTYILDVVSELTAADGDVLFGDTKEGMFAIRFDRTLRVKGDTAKSKLVNSAGDQDGAVWGKRATWIATIGPDEKGEPVVIGMLDHPANLRHPTWWHARDYGLSAANPFGIHDFENKPDKSLGNHILKQGETLVFRYQVIFHHGDLESADMAGKWQSFSKQP